MICSRIQMSCPMWSAAAAQVRRRATKERQMPPHLRCLWAIIGSLKWAPWVVEDTAGRPSTTAPESEWTSLKKISAELANLSHTRPRP